MRKGQAAMEFLMTYGWAILVVLIAIGVLAYAGVLNPESALPDKCTIASGSGMFCDEFTTDATAGTVTVRTKNILTEAIEVEAFTLDSPACAYDVGTSGSFSIAADETSDVVLDCTTGLTSGDKIKGDFAISYHTGNDGLNKTTSGTITTKIA